MGAATDPFHLGGTVPEHAVELLQELVDSPEIDAHACCSAAVLVRQRDSAGALGAGCLGDEPKALELPPRALQVLAVRWFPLGHLVERELGVRVFEWDVHRFRRARRGKSFVAEDGVVLINERLHLTPLLSSVVDARRSPLNVVLRITRLTLQRKGFVLQDLRHRSVRHGNVRVVHARPEAVAHAGGVDSVSQVDVPLCRLLAPLHRTLARTSRSAR